MVWGDCGNEKDQVNASFPMPCDRADDKMQTREHLVSGQGVFLFRQIPRGAIQTRVPKWIVAVFLAQG